MFTIRQAVGKGLGVFAAKPIIKGQRILADRALLTLTPSDTSGSILRQAHALPTAGQKSLLSLSINPSKSGVLSWTESLWQSKTTPGRTVLNHTILNIFRNNNFDIGNQIQALFPQVARLNHSCVPNAQGNFNKKLDAFTIHATRDIKPDEEITISYLDEHLGLRHSRQSVLQNGYGFTCDCTACNSSTADAGEARRIEVARKLERFAELASEDPNDEFEMMLTLLEAYDVEKIRGREVATIHIAAARKAFELGKTDQGRDLALKGLQLEEEAVGRDSQFYKSTRKQVKGLGIELGV
ncbi:set domain-containing protein 5 [Colletotrichum truncatum]|uniref:Set domain-containing protein 5 n=1 Tax=Colletotrichum truncatum TaxID=5467 RepID=A0ACC3ZGI9_COLTU|nr:set domain-containing protein 5 [Colletotrichum truncatum]KAF6784735.1 set domain-containing protein 5 [Colletotrichum truncatum]